MPRSPGISEPSRAPLEVLVTYTSYPLSGNDWRGRFMHDLVHGLAARPDLRLRLWGPPGPVPSDAAQTATVHETKSLTRLLENGGIAHLLRQRKWAALSASAELLRELRSAYKRNADIDVAHVNWLQNALPLWGTSTPALVSVLGSDIRFLSIPGMRSALRRVFRQRACIIAPNAEWMLPVLEKEFGNVAEIWPIPFGVDARWFQVQRERGSTEIHKWLVVLRLTRDKIGPLFSWASEVLDRGHELHLFGPNQDALDIPNWVHYHGPTDPVTLRNQWFPTASGLVSLSQHDEGRPQVILEAMAAGLPIIASPIPAHRNVIDDKRTGLLAGSKSEFSAAVATLSNLQTNHELGQRARQWARDTVGTWQDCAARYTKAYRHLAEAAQ